jgi:hypothetical protein
MEQQKIICPCCGEDLTVLIESEINRRAEEEKRIKLEIAIEKKRKSNEKRSESLKQWRAENHDTVVLIAQKASNARTKESHKKQAESLKQTNEMKMIKFAELVMEARSNGIEITAEINKELMKKARDLAKKEIAESKKKVRSLKIQ